MPYRYWLRPCLPSFWVSPADDARAAESSDTVTSVGAETLFVFTRGLSTDQNGDIDD
jgi:hypothetical protein